MERQDCNSESRQQGYLRQDDKNCCLHKQASAQLEAVVSYGMVYKGTQKWGDLQETESRSLDPIELVKEDKLGLLGAQRLAELYGRGKKYCKFIYERYPTTGTRFVLSNKDNLANEVIDNFYTGKKSKLTFEGNHHLATELNINPTFQTYWGTYLNAVGSMINDNVTRKEEKILRSYFPADKKVDRSKPNFSVFSEIASFDYYGLMGCVQQIEVNIEIFRMFENNYLVNTIMYIRDTYGTDKQDIDGIVNVKAFSQSLPAFYVLQNCFGCHPFVTEIIYKHSDIINIPRL